MAICLAKGNLIKRFNSKLIFILILSCIEKWLSSNQKCPQCNHPNKTRDIRRIYAKSFKVLDNTELTEALKNVESERSLRKHAEINRQEAKLQYQQLNEKYGLLKEELERYK